MNRRSFIKTSTFRLGGVVAASHLANQIMGEWAFADSGAPIPIMDPRPLQRVSWQSLNSNDFNGDDIERTHEALWNREGYIEKRGGIPAVTEATDVIVIGGGLSGLWSAYLLKDRKPILLEQGVNLGGNSRGEYFDGSSPFSIGGAYITKPELGSELYQRLNEIGVVGRGRAESSNETLVSYKNNFYQGFWNGAAAPEAAPQFQQVYQQLNWILENKFPEIPWNPTSQVSKQELWALDQISFAQWLHQQFGVLHPAILEYFQLYCWSSFGGSIEELSAAQALNFLAAETDEVIAFPGGNAALAQTLYYQLQNQIGASSVRAGSLVLDVSIHGDGVRICYETPERILKTIKANKVVMATPKFVAKRIISNMPPDQIKACEEIDYRAYVVANIFVDIRRWKAQQKTFSPCFDLYCLQGDVPDQPSAMRPPSRPFADVCFGSWAQADQGNLGILTVYKPLPYQGARQFLFNPLSHAKHRNSILSGAQPILQNLGVLDSEVLGVRLTRWGHAMPLAEVGALSSGYLDVATRPIDQKIFFANQDNYCNPSFESAFAAACEVRDRILNDK